MEAARRLLWVIAALIHVPPLAGVTGGGALRRLYGTDVDDPSLRTMLRHRAVLFAPVVLALLAAAWTPRVGPRAR